MKELTESAEWLALQEHYEEIKDVHMRDMFENDKVDGIFCVRGGYGVARMIRQINYDAIKANPKVLVGYSDITALHYAIYSQTGLVTFHGPVAVSTWNSFSYDYFKKLLFESFLQFWHFRF